MGLKQRFKIAFSLFLLALFVSYQVGVIAFTHVHYVNGVMVVHSHPSTNSSHQHTASQIVLFSLLGHIDTDEHVPFVWIAGMAASVLYALLFPSQISTVEGVHLKNLRLRAPPIVSVV